MVDRYNKAQFTKNHIHFTGGDKCKRKKIVFKDGTYEWKDTTKNDLGHETFVLNRTVKQHDWVEERSEDALVFNCCKTARKPYDLMVQACLILFKYYFPIVEVSSDGDFDDWREAIKFVGEALPNLKGFCMEILLGDGSNLFTR